MVSPQPELVASHVEAALAQAGVTDGAVLFRRVLADITAAFAGHRPGFRANDMRYHNLAHTLQATTCTADLIAGQVRCGDLAGFTARTAELTVVASMLHDVGFLKEATDASGTGAKYTWVHERRSCEFAREYLPAIGVTPAEIEDICAAISCTGPRNRITTHNFASPTARRMACLLVTADYLSQMGAPDYPAKLEALYDEFLEAFDHDGIPVDQRPYRSLAELRGKTADFWAKYVRPMLDSEAEGVHRFLHITGQPNPYFQAIAQNLAVIRASAT